MWAIPFFALLGNAQDDAAPAVTGYAAQGNVEMNQARHEAEMESAVRTARERKALKEAMAAYVPQPSDITTAERFLSVNRPPGASAREGDAETSPVKRSAYVPRFETTTDRAHPSAAPTESIPVADPSSAGSPATVRPPDEDKRGLFSFLRPRQSRAEGTTSGPGFLSSSALAPPPSDYPTPVAPPAPGAPGEDAAAASENAIAVPFGSGEADEALAADRAEAISAATVSPAASGENPGFLRRLFGKGKSGDQR